MSRSGIMLCVPLEERRLPDTGWVNAWKSWPVVVQPKLDGERSRGVYNGPFEDWDLISSELNLFNSVPHINDALRVQLSHKIEPDGELYLHGLSFEDIHSIVSRTTNFHPDYETMQYHIFDLITDDLQHQRLVQLKGLNLKLPLVMVSCYLAWSFEEIMKYYHEILDQGYEGIVIRDIDNYYKRSRSQQIMKFKPKKQDYYKIKGFSIEVDIHGEVKEGRLGRLICAGPEGADLPVLGLYPAHTKPPEGYFGVGSGFSADQRIKYWEIREAILNMICDVKYQHITPGKGVPRFPVFVEIVDGDPGASFKI